jgi:hypothetical protein
VKIKKGDAFVISEGVVLLVYVIAVCVTRGDVSGYIGAVLAAIVGIATAFIAGNVADNGVKGANYQQGLADQGMGK